MRSGVILVVVGLLALVNGHSWMRVPMGRFINNTPQASQVAPCGNGTYPVTHDVAAGRATDVSWENNGHDNSDNPVVLSLLTPNETFYMQIKSTSYESGSDTAANPNPLSVRIPRSVEGGSYLLQWAWSGYYTCASLNITGSNVTSIQLTEGGQGYGTATPEYVFYEITYNDDTDFLFVEITDAPTGTNYITAILGSDDNPTPTYNEGMIDSSDSADIAFGACNDDGTTTYTVAVRGENGATGTYGIRGTSYPGLVNIGDEIQGVPHTGYRWFRTDAYATFETPRRTVIESDSEMESELAILALNCELTEENDTAIAVGDFKQCFQLSENEDTKYFRVPPQADAYTIITEEGLCEDLSADASTIGSVVVLAIGLITIALF
jgi:hypothetical protein